MPPEDIWWDALVFPCGTGDQNYLGSAAQTIEGVRALKELFPDTKTILGISNVSFGLPDAGREVLNSVFLYHCTKAGLDAAIVNTEKLARYADIPEEERELAEALIFLPPGDVEAGNAGGRGVHRPLPRPQRRRPPPGRAPSCRSSSAWRAPSSRAARRGSRRTSKPRSPTRAGRRRSTSSTAR